MESVSVTSDHGILSTGLEARTGTRAVVAPLVIFLATRVLLALVARYATHLIHPLHRYPIYLPGQVGGALHPWLSPWFRFDAYWFVTVAEHGYRYGSPSVADTNFFPLYPLTIRLLTTLGVNPWIAAIVISNIGFAGALILLWQLLERRAGADVALRGTVLVAVFPFAFFFAAPYAESLFLLLAVATFLAADRGRWVEAALWCGLAAVTRPTGLAVVAALVLLGWQSSRRDAAIATLSLLPFLAFVVGIWLAFGHPFAWLIPHTAGWVPAHGSLAHIIAAQFHTSLSPFDRVDAVVAAVFLLSAITVARRFGASYALYVALGILMPLAHGLCCMERYSIVLFPAQSAWAGWRAPMLQAALFAVSLAGLILFTALFATGYSIF